MYLSLLFLSVASQQVCVEGNISCSFDSFLQVKCLVIKFISVFCILLCFFSRYTHSCCLPFTSKVRILSSELEISTLPPDFRIQDGRSVHERVKVVVICCLFARLSSFVSNQSFTRFCPRSISGYVVTVFICAKYCVMLC